MRPALTLESLICVTIILQMKRKYYAELQSIDVAKSLFCKEQNQMLDLILLAVGLGFFALSIGYTIACDRL
jgi:hypothetical protein